MYDKNSLLLAGTNNQGQPKTRLCEEAGAVSLPGLQPPMLLLCQGFFDNPRKSLTLPGPRAALANYVSSLGWLFHELFHLLEARCKRTGGP